METYCRLVQSWMSGNSNSQARIKYGFIFKNCIKIGSGGINTTKNRIIQSNRTPTMSTSDLVRGIPMTKLQIT